MGFKATRILQQVFPGLSEAYLADLVGVAEVHDYPPGIDLCREGQVEETFYAIVGGAADVIKRFDADSERVLPATGGVIG